jgi:putative DNA-invertase from lambdoid prophage Rac
LHRSGWRRPGWRRGKRRLIPETVSGSSPIKRRLGFMKLLDQLDVAMTCWWRRSWIAWVAYSIDVQSTVNRLAELGIRVHYLALGGVDLTSPAGKMTMGVIAAVAQFEKDF